MQKRESDCSGPLAVLLEERRGNPHLAARCYRLLGLRTAFVRRTGPDTKHAPPCFVHLHPGNCAPVFHGFTPLKQDPPRELSLHPEPPLARNTLVRTGAQTKSVRRN